MIGNKNKNNFALRKATTQNCYLKPKVWYTKVEIYFVSLYFDILSLLFFFLRLFEQIVNVLFVTVKQPTKSLLIFESNLIVFCQLSYR